MYSWVDVLPPKVDVNAWHKVEGINKDQGLQQRLNTRPLVDSVYRKKYSY